MPGERMATKEVTKMQTMMTRALTGIVEAHCKCKVTWDIGYIYRAYELKTGRLVATYNTISDKLILIDEDKRAQELS